MHIRWVPRLPRIPLLALLLATALGSGVVRAGPPAPPLVRTPVSDRDYGSLVVAPHAGRVLLVSFWATYCLPCIEELPGLLKLKAKLAKHGVDVVFVNADGPGAPPELMSGVLERRAIALGQTFVVTQANPEAFIAAVDPSWAGQVPFHVVYGKDGARLRALSGAMPLAELEQAAMAALGPLPARHPPPGP